MGSKFLYWQEYIQKESVLYSLEPISDKLLLVEDGRYNIDPSVNTVQRARSFVALNSK